VVSLAKLRPYGLVLGIFVLGAGAGAAGGYAVASKRLADVFGSDRPGFGEARRIEALSSELDLTREQRRQLRQIMERHRDEYRELTRTMFEKCGDDLQGLRERVDQEIKGVLNESQARRFKELTAERGRRFPLGRGPRRHKD
jgi:Spy/CpxP family protein refolding chaperone